MFKLRENVIIIWQLISIYHVVAIPSLPQVTT